MPGDATVDGHNQPAAQDGSARLQVVEHPLDAAHLASLVSWSACGAVAVFVGVVRDENAGRRVQWLDYEAYAPLALRSFRRIEEEARVRWPSLRLAIHHRVGRVEIGEASVVIACAAPHRAEAFAGTRYAIERLKQISPIWKHEHFEGGAVWVEGAPAAPDDEDARRVAMERACS